MMLYSEIVLFKTYYHNAVLSDIYVCMHSFVCLCVCVKTVTVKQITRHAVLVIMDNHIISRLLL